LDRKVKIINNENNNNENSIVIIVNFRFFFKIISHFFIGMTLPLALSASSYNEDDASGTTIQNSKALYMSRNNLEINKNTNDSSNNTKSKNNYRKTIKQKQNVPNQSKLSALLKSMDEASDSEDDDNDNYGGGNGNASGSGNGSSMGNMGNMGNMSSNYLGVSNNQNSNQSNDDTTYIKDIPTTNGNPISNTMYASLPSNYANQYYNQFVSAANKGYGSGLGSDNTYDSSVSMPKNELIEKLNYIIDLLEEQQDYKTNSILEDLILYAFLGIFIIFIVDSFSKSNKYVR
jgi:hypothetical protein